MNKKKLEQVKKEYSDIKKAIYTNFEEIKELEKRPLVKRYLFLKKLQEMVQRGDLNSDYNIVSHCIHDCGEINETNAIYMLMFECTIDKIENIMRRPILEEEEDVSKIVAYYLDIENPSRHAIVLKEEQDLFESTHKVITGKTSIYDADDRYNNLRNEFFNLCIQEGQEKTVQLLLKKYPKNEVDK